MNAPFPIRKECPPGACVCNRQALLSDPQADIRILKLTREEESRLLARLETIQRANVLVVVAGMEGALPSVVAGLVSKPVIAVPTSIGYGASFGGVAALLGMLNSCANGVSVVNIDNGFGAACVASAINHL